MNRLADIEGALQGRLAASGSDSPQTPEVLGRLADVYQSTGRLDLAERELTRALDVADRIAGPRTELSARVHVQLATVCKAQQRGDAAAKHDRVAAEILKRHAGVATAPAEG